MVVVNLGWSARADEVAAVRVDPAARDAGARARLAHEAHLVRVRVRVSIALQPGLQVRVRVRVRVSIARWRRTLLCPPTWSGSVVRVRLGVWVSGQGQWSGSVVRVVVWVRVSGQRSG